MYVHYITFRKKKKKKVKVYVISFFQVNTKQTFCPLEQGELVSGCRNPLFYLGSLFVFFVCFLNQKGIKG